MAVDKLVDSGQLDSDLEDIADAIRAKGGTSADLSFPNGFITAIENLPSGGGGTRTTIVPEQTVTASSAGTYIQFNEGLVEGESYIVTINGETKSIVCTLTNASYELYFTSQIEVIWIYGDMVFYLDSSSLYGTYTVKVEQESGGGGSTLVTKTITTNGTYDPADDDADGYSEVTVNVPGNWTLLASQEFAVNTTSTQAASVDNVQLNQSDLIDPEKPIWVHIRDKAGKRSGYFYGSDYIYFNYIRKNSSSATDSFTSGFYSLLYVDSSGNYKTTTGVNYGVYARYLQHTASNHYVQIYRRYNSSYGTINGTFKVDVYQLTKPWDYFGT